MIKMFKKTKKNLCKSVKISIHLDLVLKQLFITLINATFVKIEIINDILLYSYMIYFNDTKHKNKNVNEMI